jgi:hypothetical protein
METTVQELSPCEYQKLLRSLEFEAYASVVSVFRAQGDLTDKKRNILQELQNLLNIPVERHRAELLRALNDERLSFRSLGETNWHNEIKNLAVANTKKWPATMSKPCYKSLADEILRKSFPKRPDTNQPIDIDDEMTAKKSDLKILKTIPVNDPTKTAENFSVTKENKKLVILTNANTKNPAIKLISSVVDSLRPVAAQNESTSKFKSNGLKRQPILFKPVIKQIQSPALHQQSKPVDDFYDERNACINKNSGTGKIQANWLDLNHANNNKRIKLFDSAVGKT